MTNLAEPSVAPTGRRRHAPIIIAVLIYLVVVLRTAWLADDAYISFRTANNFVNGYGLTWNTDERVQTFTHPLWLFVIAAAHFLTREMFFTALGVSVAVSMATIGLVGFGAARSTIAAVMGVAALTLSRAYVDYSTSGLENPLSHLLLAAFVLVAFRADMPALRRLRWLAMIAGLATLNRMDSVLIYLPALALAAYQTRSLKAAGALAAGFSPMAAWEAFSLYYYGFLFPNTAYAKLNNGIDSLALAMQGAHYLQESLAVDPLTLVVIMAGIAFSAIAARAHFRLVGAREQIRRSASTSPTFLKFTLTAWRRRDPREAAMGAGSLLYLAYVVSIGGDFMSGRFLTLPLLASVMTLARIDWERPRYWQIGLIALAILSPVPRIVANPEQAAEATDRQFGDSTTAGRWGIADERSYYFGCASLSLALESPNEEHPACDTVARGLTDRLDWRPARMGLNVGYYGYFVGPDVHIVDQVGLGDPLLARLKPAPNAHWRIGHFLRPIPAGYFDTFVYGRNRIENAALAAYYDRLSLIVRGELFDPRRLAEIWMFNTGQSDYLLADYNSN